MEYIPKHHQSIGEQWLMSHDRCALFLDMGLGKTVITLTALKRMIYNDFRLHKVLVVAPLNVARLTWEAEIRKWDHLKDMTYSKVLGSEKQRLEALTKEADIYLINRENVSWLVDTMGSKWPFDGLVLDELSSFKSARSERFRKLKRVTGLCKVVIGLTGTPAPNGYLDLWSQIFLIDSGERLGTRVTKYRQKYFSPGRGKGHVIYEWNIREGAKEEIDRKLQNLCLSMKKEDWLKMPPITYNPVIVDMPESGWKKYRFLMKEKVLPLLKGDITTDVVHADRMVTPANAAVISSKLLQMSGGFLYDDDGKTICIHEEKLHRLKGILEEAGGEPILVFYGFQHEKEAILKSFPEAAVLDHEPEDTLARWNAGKISLLLLHPASAGHGLNLQKGGHIMVWYSLPWSLELYEQANARLYRTGQEHPVIVHQMICQNTMDEKVLSALDRKHMDQNALMDALRKEVMPYDKEGVL